MSLRSFAPIAAERTNLPTRVGLCTRAGHGLCVLLAIGMLMALAAAPAFAERVYESRIEGFGHPYGIAIDDHGGTWISDPGHEGLISKYDPYPSQTKEGEQSGSGNFGNAGELIFGIAINDSNGDLYLAENTNQSIDVFEKGTGALIEQWGGFGGFPLTVAVDNSGGSSNGQIYVAGGTTVKAFEPEQRGAPFSAEETYIKSNTITGTPNGPFGSVENVAVDNHGNIYVVDAGYRVVDEFSSAGVFIRAFGETGAPPDFGAGSAPASFDALTAVAVDPTNGHVLVVDASNNVVDEFNSSGQYLGDIMGPEVTDGESFQYLGGGIAINSEGYVYVSEGWVYAQQGGNGKVDIFSPVTVRPKVAYDPVTNRTQSAGTLNATVTLNGGPNVTSCTFEYGTDMSYGTSVPCVQPTPFTGTTAVSAELSGLSTETTYHYRVVLVTENGVKRGTDQTYTPHAVSALTTEPATDLTRVAATLNGTFEGNAEATHYYFEWGPTEAFGNETEVKSAGSPGKHELIAESASLSGLSVETTYYYRFVAENSAGITRGPTQSFETFGEVEHLATEPASNVTATSATLNGSFDGNSEETHYYFEWGTTESYGNSTELEDAGKPGLLEHVAETVGLGHLEIDSTYHYRFVAENPAGTTLGPDRSFTTLARYQFSSDFGSAGSGEDQFENPQDVAVENSTGDIYVADTGNHRVVKLDSTGRFLLMFGQGVDKSTGGSVCPEHTGDECQAGTSGSAAGQFEAPRYVAVDNSGSPSAGDVYVADTTDDLIQKFDPEGHLITGWEDGGGKRYSAGIEGIAVRSDGQLIVATGKGGAGIAVDAFGTVHSGPVAIDPSTNDLYTDTGVEIERSTSPSGCTAAGAEDCPAIEFFGRGDLSSAAGLAFYPSIEALYVANSGANDIAVFTPRPLPRVTTGSVVSSASTSATLTGEVEPWPGEEVTQCQFEYGPEEGNYNLGTLPCEPAPHFSGSERVQAVLTKLVPGSTYHYRLVATDAGGQNLFRYGHDRTFVSIPGIVPSVDSTSSSSVTPTTVQLAASIDPNLIPTIFRFEYGTTTGYGSKTLPSESIGEDASDHTVSAELTGLAAATTYHFRVVAMNLNGVTDGPDESFTTPDTPTIVEAGASTVTETGANLSALIRPGFRSTVYHFEYGPTAAYGSSTIQGAPIVADDSSHTASAAITGLRPDTIYHFRVIASNEIGTTVGSDQTFTTAPQSERTIEPPHSCSKSAIFEHGSCDCRRGFIKRRSNCVKRVPHGRHHKVKRHKHGHRATKRSKPSVRS